MLWVYFKMLKYKLREQSWRLIVPISDKTDEAQVKVTSVRNEGKTKKLFFLYYALNDKRAGVIVFSSNTQKIP